MCSKNTHGDKSTKPLTLEEVLRLYQEKGMTHIPDEVTVDDVLNLIDTYKDALKPFGHKDLCKFVGGQEYIDSPVFGRDKAILTIDNFRQARKLSRGDE